MARIIIGIHGLNNKPAERILYDWWLRSIRAGLKNQGLPDLYFSFRLFYWADLLYQRPLDPDQRDLDHPLVLVERWAQAGAREVSSISRLRRGARNALEKAADVLLKSETISRRARKMSNEFIASRFRDLDCYLNGDPGCGRAAERPVREVIGARLKRILLQYKNDRIMLLAHSMGSVIAYDVLLQMPPGVYVDCLVSFGSPLGQTMLVERLLKSSDRETGLKTPEALKRWVNLADIDDYVALDPELGDDFAANSMGVKPEDYLVKNSFKYNGLANPHSSYGYLQTPACAALCAEFLAADRSLPAIYFLKMMRGLKDLVGRRPYDVNKPSPFPPGSKKKQH